MKRIGFFGHSNCAYRSVGSFIDLFSNYFNASIENIGVRQGSEERILFELKKTKNLDLAIIFHGEPGNIFLPDCDRDLNFNYVNETKAGYLFRDWNNDFSKAHHEKFTKKFKTPENFLNTTIILREYFYHPDLQMNRFIGCLMQIDQYLLDQNLPCIHILEKTNAIPNWFKFKSGIVDYSVTDIIKNNPLKKGEVFANCTTSQGNTLIFERLKELAVDLIPSSPGAVA